MDANTVIRSQHLHELLRFGEHQHGIPLNWGRGADACGLVFIPNSSNNGEPIELDGLTIAGMYENELHMVHDLDAIASGRVDPPTDDTGGAFVSRVLDTVLDTAAAVYNRRVRDRQRRLYVRARSRGVENQISTLRTSSSTLRNKILMLEDELRHSWRRKTAVVTQLRAAVGLTRVDVRTQAEEEFRLLWGLVPGRLAAVALSDTALTVTTQPICINHQDVSYSLGRYSVRIPFDPMAPVVVSALDQVGTTSYPHPHVASDGVVCWGNLHSPITELRAVGDLFHVVMLTDRLLSSYNPANPYVELERWDPDWQEDGFYARCLRNAGAQSDCAQCTDDDCPYWPDRYTRCAESIGDDPDQMQDCVDCGTCGHYAVVEELLAQLENQPEDQPAATPQEAV